AMGIVYRAQDPAIGRLVAIKTIRLADLSDTTERERLRERLFREAQSAGILSHPGIVVVYDVGEQDDVTYIAMEFVNGPSLEKLFMAEEPPEPETILNVLRQTGAALDYAHKKGIVHRDIKPANIMIDQDGTVKITDFGVAKLAASHQLTQAGTVLGTPNYMSPEQVQGKEVDGRADQFSLAVCAYEMLTGEKPFTGEQLTTVLYKIVSEEPPAPERLNPTLGFAVSMVVARALAKSPAKRYPTCTEFVTALDTALKSKKGWRALPRGASQSLPTAVVGTSPELALPASRRTRPVEEEPKRRGAVWRYAATALVALGVIGLGFVAVQKYMRAPHEEAQVERPAPAASAPPAAAPGQARESAPPATPQVAQGTQPPETPAPAPAPPEAVKEKPTAMPPARTSGAAERAGRAEPEAQPLQVVTSPPGARAQLDNDASKTCTSPCNFQVASGRHTLALTLDGYRQELRIVDVSGPKELFVGLSRPTGTVRVESAPAGAQILINGQLRKETTPATLVLPTGQYTLTVSKDGRKADQPVEVKDGSLLKFELQLNP
ncbi:MAG TPA: serine/threonine-protein kinase, partial [Bryobacteraceae bacterium]|nr:serine/threonine-protein kinase [Bryobacteraceae bacterium]